MGRVRRFGTRVTASAVAVATVVGIGIAAPQAVADPAPPSTSQPPKPAAPKPEPPKPAPQTPAPQTARPAAAGPVLPGVKVTNVFWYSDRRVALWVHSTAMNADIQVQLLLPRDWNVAPSATFPQLYMLDGLRAREDQNGWTINTDIEKFFKDKNVTVVLPVGGQSSFYTDWKEPDKGKLYRWETFLTRELPPILETQWRATSTRGVAGLSMGGTSALMLATRHPDFYKFAASYSGVLQLTSVGMQQAIQFAMKDAGGYDATKMFGQPSDPAWKEHDPYLLADKLRGMSVYMSTGNGMVGPHDTPGSIPGLATNYAGVGLEVLARVTTQQYAAKLNKLGVAARAVFRPSGTHTWPYWQFELHESWPQAATALGVEGTKPNCVPRGAIADKVKGDKTLGECLTPEYDVPGGKAQDFRNGRVFWSPKTGAKIVGGGIGGAYVAAAGPGGYLGFPTSDEGAIIRGGRVSDFERGKIYWTTRSGAHAVRGAILEQWAKDGYERGRLGYPIGDEVDAPGGGRMQQFENGVITVK